MFVGNLSFETTAQELSALLSEVGTAVRVHVGTDRETGKSRGFAFVEFASGAEAADAIKRFDGYELSGRRLRVNGAEERPPRSATGRPGAPPYVPPPRDTYQMEAPASFDGGLPGGRMFKTKGSRRRLRARKRSLGY